MESVKDKTTESRAGKGVVVLLVIIVMGLGATVGILLSKQKEKEEEWAKVQLLLEDHRMLLENELTALQGDFGALQTDNDSLMNLASEQQERITRLLAIQADNAHRIRLYQRELETLRGVLRGYIVQVDSLNTSNIALREQGRTLRRDLDEERRQRAEVVQHRDELTTTVQRAQVLTASDIATIGMNNRDRETPRVRNIVRLQTCFTVRENPVAAHGERTIYLVLVLPNKAVLQNRNNTTFLTHEGAEIVYTDKRVIDYTNSDIVACIYSENNNRLIEGNYEVKLYCDGYLIGTSSFVLRN